MISNLPKWYRVASINTVTEETLEKRTTSINSILETKDLQWILECIRLYLQKQNKSREFANEFFLAFNKDDGMFLDEDTDLEKRVLAGAIVAQCIEKRPADNITIAMAVKSAIFGVENSAILNIDIVQTAVDFLLRKSIEVREANVKTQTAPKYPVLKEEAQTVETLTAYVTSLSPYIKALAGNMDNQNNSIKHRISVLEEESNIHWWLFRCYSALLGKSVKELSGVEAPLVLAQELSELIGILPPPPNSKQFLKKMLSNVSGKENKETSIKQSVEILSTALHDKIGEKPLEIYWNITPVFFGYSKAVESGGDQGWTAIFEKNTGLKADANFNSIDMAEQFLIESILLNL